MDTRRKRGTIRYAAQGLLAAALVTAGPIWAQDAVVEPPPSETDALKRIETLEKELNALKKTVKEGVEADKEAAKVNPKVEVGTKGLSVTSADGAHQLQLRVRLAVDYGGIWEDDELNEFQSPSATAPAFGEQDDGVDFRYARLIVQGFVFKDFKYQIETDFAGDTGATSPTFKDVFIEYDKIPYGGGRTFGLRVGHFKEPINLEDQISTPDLVFLEKPLLDIFVPSRNVGLMVSDAVIGQPTKERMTWALGVFKETDENPGPSDNDEYRGWSVSTRLSGLPYSDKGGRRLIHLGFGYSHRTPNGGNVDYRVRSESRIVEARYIDPNLTAIANADLPAGVVRLNATDVQTIDLFDAELAGVVGPWWWQAEYLHSMLDTDNEGTLGFDGYYVQTGYVITGEKRNYNHARGTFTPPVPKKNFSPFRGQGQGWGAWEVAGRYSFVDMTDGPVQGGKQTAYTFGLNWYANPNIRWALNYIHNDIDNDFYDGDFDVLQSRVQIAF